MGTDLGEDKVEKLLAQEVDFDKAGQDHVKGKPHKRRLHALKTDPYTIEEANRAAGMGSFILPGKRKMETLIPEAIKNGEELEDVRKRAKLEGDIAVESPALALDLDGDVKM